jgi:Co/Zn/Cd efflux system component
MMIGEIAAGYITGCMALLVDGFHMATHVGIVSVVAAAGVSADAIRERLAPVHELSRLTVEYRNA